MLSLLVNQVLSMEVKPRVDHHANLVEFQGKVMQKNREKILLALTPEFQKQIDLQHTANMSWDAAIRHLNNLKSEGIAECRERVLNGKVVERSWRLK